MFLGKYTRDANAVKKHIVDTGNSIIAKSDVKIFLPAHYQQVHLATIERNISIIAVYAMVVNDSVYAVSNTLCRVTITPRSYSIETHNGTEWLVFNFEKDDVIIPDTTVIRDKIFVYRCNDEFVTKGKVPEFIDYANDRTTFYATATKFGSVDYGVDPAILELMATMTARDPKDLLVPFRLCKDKNAVPVYIDMDNINYNTTNASAKLLGNYARTGLTSALITDSNNLETLERTLRS